MQKELSHIFKQQLAALPFVGLLSGMVQTVTRERPTGETGAMDVQKMPVSYDTNLSGCDGKEVAMIPQTRFKSVIYFEDFGVSTTGKVHGLTEYQSALRLICWLNKSKITDTYREITAAAISKIVEIIANKNPRNSGIFTRLTVNVARIHPQDANLFSKYTYNETDRQYLRPPFEFFGIDLSSKFSINSKCVEEISWDQLACS